MKLLLTGGTGSVGVEFLRRASVTRAFDAVRVVIRAESEAELEARWRTLVADATDGRLAPDDLPDWRPMAGTIAAPNLGLAPNDLAWTERHATHVVHAAAITDFNADLAQTRPVNVLGTRHALDVARRARRLEAFAHVSTLYVAGRRTGIIGEDELEHECGFLNAYEQSKYEAEQYVRAHGADLPVTTYRLSLLMGRASDGYVHRTLEAHKMFELFLSGRARRIPGTPDNPLDMLPTDYAATMMHDLLVEHFAAGDTVQISAGASAPTGADLVDTCRRVLERPDWNVEWIDEAEWSHLRAEDGGDELSPAAFWMFDVVADYLYLPKQFVRTRLDAAVGAAAVPPAPLDYLPRIIAARAACNWGRA